MFNQFYPFQPIQFMDGLLAPPIGVNGISPLQLTYLGTINGSRSSNTITYSGLPDHSTYPEVLALTSWRRDSDGERLTSAITFGGNSGSIMVQDNNTSRQAAGGAICRYAGAWTGDIVCTMNGSTEADHRMTLIGLNKTISTVVQASSSVGNSTSISNNPSDPGALGLRLVHVSTNSATFGVTWSNSTQIDDAPGTVHSHGNAYDSGADSTAIIATRGVAINYAAMFISIN